MVLNDSTANQNQYQNQIGGIDIQSFLLLKAGLKPVIRVGCPKNNIEENLRELKRLFRGTGIKILVGEFKNNFYGQKIKEPIYNLYFSLSIDLARQAYVAEKTGDRKTFGRLLGYPSCCTKSFIENYDQKDYDFTIYALLQSRSRVSFYCNFIFNFDSKLGGEGIKIFQQTAEIWRPSQHLFLIKHIPCSFDCRESIKLGQKTLKILRKARPRLAQEIERALKKPVLYFDYFNWLVFDGEVKGNQLKCHQVLPYQSLFPEEKRDLVKRGNRLAVDDNWISVFQNQKMIGRIKKENKYRGVLINFK